MALTKTQINYLENKLDRVVVEKLEEFKKKLGDGTTLEKEIVNRLNAGEIKLLSYDDILDLIRNKYTTSHTGYYYSRAISIEELIKEQDRIRIEKEINKRQDKISEYYTQLNDAKRNALDKIVLEGVDVDTAIKELNKIK